MQALLFAGLLAAFIGASQAAEATVTTFPYCPCQSAVKFPPYKWTLTSKTTKGDETTYCYNIETFKYTGSTNYSCVNYDLRKIEIDTVIGCQGYIKDLYFNGTYLSRSTQYFGDFGVVSKFTRGKGLPLASFDDMFAEQGGVSACFTLFGKCNTEEKFCVGGVPCQVAFFDNKNNCCPKPLYSSPPPPKSPSPPPPKSPSPPPPKSPSPPPPESPSPPPPKSPSPPPPKSPSPPPPKSPSPPPPPIPIDVPLAPGELFPPPPPAGGSDFPYCPCNRTAAGPYSFTGPKISSDPGGTKYCYTLTTKRVAGDYPCANYDLRKIELDINLGCRTASKLVSFDGTQLAASYQFFQAPVNGLVFKIVRASSLKFPLGTQADLIGKQKEVCFVLPTDGECNSLEKFCRGADCKFSFFSPNNKCCEISAY